MTVSARASKAMLILAAWSLPASGLAQNTLGDVIDAGGTLLTSDEFRAEVVQRLIRGDTGIGVGIVIVFTSNGQIHGISSSSRFQGYGLGTGATIDGEWRIDDAGRICSTMRVDNARNKGTVMPARCQYWFKLGESYFLSDSDSDRRVKVLMRTPLP